MKLAYISDLHVDITPANQAAIAFLRDLVEDIRPDVLLIGGDISHSLRGIEMCFHRLSMLPTRILFVAGNHDIWVFNEEPYAGPLNSTVKYFTAIPEICETYGVHCLHTRPLILGEVGFAGTIGWYDYSFRRSEFDSELPLSQYEKKRLAGSVWNDVNYAHWIPPLCANQVTHEAYDAIRCLPAFLIDELVEERVSDVEVTHQFLEELRKQLDWLNPRVSTIVVCIHHLPFRELVSYRNEFPYDFFSAFMGSASFGDLVKHYPKVKYVFSGHTHQYHRRRIGALQAVVSPLGYLRGISRQEEIRRRVRERLVVMHV
jgi:predicted phosphodiesterase